MPRAKRMYGSETARREAIIVASRAIPLAS